MSKRHKTPAQKDMAGIEARAQFKAAEERRENRESWISHYLSMSFWHAVRAEESRTKARELEQEDS